MVRIEDGKPGRPDGAYARLFNSPEIGALISRIHAASIRAGTELEKIVEREAKANGTAIVELDAFLDNGHDGVFVAAKKQVKACKAINFPEAEPDYLIFVRKGTRRHCYVVELKDGDVFDTKKAAGEIATLTRFSTSVGSKLSYATGIRICSFNQDDKTAIVAGFKNAVGIGEVWTGREFCNLLGFDYDAIVQERLADADANRRFLIAELQRMAG